MHFQEALVEKTSLYIHHSTGHTLSIYLTYVFASAPPDCCKRIVSLLQLAQDSSIIQDDFFDKRH